MADAHQTRKLRRDEIHVLDLSLEAQEAQRFAQDRSALAEALGTDAVDPDRVQRIRPRDLESVGLAAYLIDGEGADAEAVAADKRRLDALTGTVLVLRPYAVPEGTVPDPRPPLRLIGSYPLEAPSTPRTPLQSTSAEGLVTGTPPAAQDPATQRRISGTVALVALGVAILIAVIVVLVAAA